VKLKHIKDKELDLKTKCTLQNIKWHYWNKYEFQRQKFTMRNSYNSFISVGSNDRESHILQQKGQNISNCAHQPQIEIHSNILHNGNICRFKVGELWKLMCSLLYRWHAFSLKILSIQNLQMCFTCKEILC
jgi:hypothetical protein